MKKPISRAIFFEAKALLDQGKKQAKIAKKLKIGTGTVSKIKNSKTYHAYCKKKAPFYAFDDAVKKVSKPTRELPERINYSEVNRDKTAIDSIFRNKLIDMTDLDRNFALDRKVKKLQVEVKKNPAFAKLVENEVALAMTDKLTKATADKQGTIDTQAKRIGELTVERDALDTQLFDLRVEVTYKERVYAQVESIAKSLSRIVVPVGILIGFIWISWLLVTHFR